VKKECFCHGDIKQAKEYAIPVKGMYKTTDNCVPIRTLLEISTRQIYKSTCGKFGTTRDMEQVHLDALWLREEINMSEADFEESSYCKLASEVTLPAEVEWYSIRFVCSRCVDYGIPHVQMVEGILRPSSEIIVKIAERPPLKGTAKALKVKASDLSRKDLIAEARKQQGKWLRDNTKHPKTWTHGDEKHRKAEHQARKMVLKYDPYLQDKLNAAWIKNKLTLTASNKWVFDVTHMVVFDLKKHRALELRDENNETIISHDLLYAPWRRSTRSFFGASDVSARCLFLGLITLYGWAESKQALGSESTVGYIYLPHYK